MAERYAVGTGNWSSTATWDGGTTLPGSGDTVHAGGFNVTIDQDITVTELTTRAGSSAPAGGVFISGTSRTLNCNIAAGTTAAMTMNGTGWTTTINGNVTGGPSGSARGIFQSTGGTCTLTINGNVAGGSGANAYGYLSSAGTITVNVVGNVSGGSGSNAIGFIGSTVSTLNVTGNAVGGSNATTYGAAVATTATINGDAIGGSNATAFGVYLNATNITVTINGDIVNDQTAEPVNVSTTGCTVVTNGLVACSTAGKFPITQTGSPEFAWLFGDNTVIRMEPSDLGAQVDFTYNSGRQLRGGGFSGGVRRTN